MINRKRNKGLSTVELIVSMIIIIIVIFGVTSVFLAKRKLDYKNKELSVTTGLAQKIISEIVNQSSGKNDEVTLKNYRSLASGTITKNLSSTVFASGFSTGIQPAGVATSSISIRSINDALSSAEKQKYVAKITVKAGDASIQQTVDTNGGCPVPNKSKKVYLDIDPISIGIANDNGNINDESSVSLFKVINNKLSQPSDNIYAKTPNSSEKSFIISILCPESTDRGRKNVKNEYNNGDIVIARTKEITVEIYYAKTLGSDSILSPQPVVVLSEKIPAPI